MRTLPGNTAFTLMPARASSCVADRVRPITPCFDAEYAARPATPMRPAADATLTIDPAPASRIARSSARRPEYTPSRFTAIVWRHWSAEDSASSTWTPEEPDSDERRVGQGWVRTWMHRVAADP